MVIFSGDALRSFTSVLRQSLPRESPRQSYILHLTIYTIHNLHLTIFYNIHLQFGQVSAA